MNDLVASSFERKIASMVKSEGPPPGKFSALLCVPWVLAVPASLWISGISAGLAMYDPYKFVFVESFQS
jgi:hypothetical protein